MKNYRLVEIRPENGERYGKPVRSTIFAGPSLEGLKQAITDYHEKPRKPWAETAYYHGSKRIYAGEI